MELAWRNAFWWPAASRRIKTSESHCLRRKSVNSIIEMREGDLRTGKEVHATSDNQSLQELADSLKACVKQKDLKRGIVIHADILKQGLLKKSLFIGNTLVNMYAKCGALAKAQEVFDDLPAQNVVSWNVLIAGYAQHGYGKKVLSCFERMTTELCPNAMTYSCILKACGNLRALEKGENIHADIINKGLLGKDSVLGNALIDMYAKCGVLAKAQSVFDDLAIKDLVSWTALIAGYAEHGLGREALECYERMKQSGFSPDLVTFGCILKACGSIRAVERGEEIHAEIVREGFLERSTVIGTALVDMYLKCGSIAKAQNAFDELPIRHLVSWTALIAGYGLTGHSEEALNCYEQMCFEGLSSDAVTFACVLNACGSVQAAEKGAGIHAEIAKRGLLSKDGVLGNAVVDMYAKCGLFAKAQQVFDQLHVRDAVTLACFLKACGSVGAVEKGEQIHAEIYQEGYLGKDSSLDNALVDMYAKCGHLIKAQEVFDKLAVRDVVGWTSLMAGYGQLVKFDAVFNVFNRLIGEGLQPDLVTFAVVLSACSCAGMVDEGRRYFEMMRAKYRIVPMVEHYTCLVDLLCRGGHFEEALGMVKKMPSSDHLPLWVALLGASHKCGNLRLGKYAFESSVQLNKKSVTPYMFMTDMHATAGMREDAGQIGILRLRNEVWE